MEEDEIQAHASKFPKVGNIGSKIASSRVNNNNNNYNEKQCQDEEEDVQLGRRGGGDGGIDRSTNRFHLHNSWNNHSSRIIRVSKASGGKDRHSKVMTSKGLRDRRVRLSVPTAIQFYDLQDRLGYDQPSKAVEWLIKAASDAISELPSLNNTFPETPRQLCDGRSRQSLVGNEREQGLFDEIDGDNNNNNNYYPQQNQSQNISLSKSACSSTSETSKGSGLSLSRSEIRVNRVKARERARKRAAAKEKEEKEKEKANESRININDNAHYHHHHNVNNNNPMSQTASFTELLTGGIGNNSSVTVPNTSNGDEVNLFHKAVTRQQQQHWSSTVTPIMDYFSPGLLVGSPSSSRTTHHHQSLIQLGTTSLPASLSPFSGENNSDQMQQQYSFIHDHLIMPEAAVVTSSSPSPQGGDHYNLNFSISSNPSSGLAGYNNNRGTLQSNHHLSLLPHHLQRFSSLDGSSNLPFFIGGATQASAAPNIDNNNNNHPQQFSSSIFDDRLQLFYGDGTRHSDQKGKGKN